MMIRVRNGHQCCQNSWSHPFKSSFDSSRGIWRSEYLKNSVPWNSYRKFGHISHCSQICTTPVDGWSKTESNWRWVKSFWTELMVMITFWKTLLQEMRHWCTGTMSKRKSSHHSGCKKCRRDQKKHAKCVHTSRWYWRFFFYSEGVVHYEFLPLGRTVNKEYYLEVMQRLRQAVRKKRTDAWRENRWMLQHDNAPSHSWSLVRDFLAKHATTVLPQPPYSPDLVPAGFSLFPKLKSTMKGLRFESTEAIKTNSLAHLRSIPKTAFQECFRTLKKRW